MVEIWDARPSQLGAVPDPRQQAQELLRSFRHMRRMTQADVAGFATCSRITVTRYEGHYDGLPKKPTIKNRRRFLRVLLRGYRLYQDEADKILILLGFGSILEEEWSKLGNPMPHFSSILRSTTERGQEQKFQTLLTTFGFHMIHAELGQARNVAEELLAIAEHEGDPELLSDSQCALGACLFHVGDLTLARAHLERASSQLRIRQDPLRVSFHPVSDSRVLSTLFLGHTLWFMGYPDQALRKVQEVVNSSMVLPHSDRGCIQFLIGAYYSVSLDVAKAREYAQTGVLLSAEFGSSHWAAKAGIILGWAQAMGGQITEGIHQMQRCLARLREDRPHLAQPYYLSLLAEAYGKNGQFDLAFQSLSEGRDTMLRTGEFMWEAVMHIAEGKLHLLQGDEASAIEGFVRALVASRRQKARVLELRAATNVALTLQTQGRTEEARCALQNVFGQFNEGFETPDLIVARRVLVSCS